MLYIFIYSRKNIGEASIIISIFRWKPEKRKAALGSERTQEFPSDGLTEDMEIICGMKMAGGACFHQKP